MGPLNFFKTSFSTQKKTLNKTNSEALFTKAKTLFPGGVNSPVRAFKSVLVRLTLSKKETVHLFGMKTIINLSTFVAVGVRSSMDITTQKSGSRLRKHWFWAQVLVRQHAKRTSWLLSLLNAYRIWKRCAS